MQAVAHSHTHQPHATSHIKHPLGCHPRTPSFLQPPSLPPPSARSAAAAPQRCRQSCGRFMRAASQAGSSHSHTHHSHTHHSSHAAHSPARPPRRRSRQPLPLAAYNRAPPAQDVVPVAQGSVRLRLLVAYDGSDFAGFQFQPKARTVQGELEKAAARVLLPASRVVGASRTDAGAHATGAVAHLDVVGSRESIEPASLMMAMNGVLPPEVKVQVLELAPPGFDSHFSSCGKEYRYKLCAGVPDPMQARQVWWVYDRWCARSRGKPQHPSDLQLDVAAMQEAAAHLVGSHDFTTFADEKRPSGLGNVKRKKPKLAAAGIKPVRTPEKNTRTLWRADVTQGEGGDSQVVTIDLAGAGFLYRMVRVIAAGLVEVGHHRLTPERFKKLLRAGDRSQLAVEAAPPHGLYLTKVLYKLPPGVDAFEAAGPDDDDDGGSLSSTADD